MVHDSIAGIGEVADETLVKQRLAVVDPAVQTH
jgi:hypothetical protein